MRRDVQDAELHILAKGVKGPFPRSAVRAVVAALEAVEVAESVGDPMERIAEQRRARIALEIARPDGPAMGFNPAEALLARESQERTWSLTHRHR